MKPQATLRDRLLLQSGILLVASTSFFLQLTAAEAGSPDCHSLQEAALDKILNTCYQHLSYTLAREMRVLIKDSLFPLLVLCLFFSHPFILLPNPLSRVTRYKNANLVFIDGLFVLLQPIFVMPQISQEKFK